MMSGRLHRRTIHLGPAKDEFVVGLVGPVEFDPSCVHRQSPIFGRIGRKLVQRHRDGLRHVRLQQNLRTIDANVRLAFHGIGRQLLGRDGRQLGTNPGAMGEDQKSIDPERLVFIDETWTRTDMGPLRGWAPCGQRLIGKVPHGRWKTMTLIAALRHDPIEAPWLLEGPIDGESFRLYVEKVLLPTLRQGDIFIMDNLGSHKGKAVRQLIRSAGAKLFFLPKYSPHLNPLPNEKWWRAFSQPWSAAAS